MQSKLPQPSEVAQFQKLILEFFTTKGRHDLPWRISEPDSTFDPYKITVSEIMLQQTQVSRVIVKYSEFLNVFPSVEALANAPLEAVLKVWAGLGYYRRAKFLHQTAEIIVREYDGSFPSSQTELNKLPGIGKNTAAAIIAYSFNQPVVFIETNIRTVYLHHFFNDQNKVADSSLLPLIEHTLYAANPREWYWALMDYGSFLKSSLQNPSRRSKHHTVQSPFKGSRRQIRGQVLRLLTLQVCTLSECKENIQDPRLPQVLEDLIHEGLIRQAGDTYHLGK